MTMGGMNVPMWRLAIGVSDSKETGVDGQVASGSKEQWQSRSKVLA